MSTTVSIKHYDEIQASAHRTPTTYRSIFDDIPAGFGQVMANLSELGIDPAGAPFTLFYQAPDGDTDGDIAMCVPVGEAGQAAVTLPAGAAASIIHRGSYDNMGESYATVSAWIHERGHSITGPTREVYLNSPAEVTEAELLTEILIPIDHEEGSA